MDKRKSIINFRVDPIEKELFDWHCGFQGTDTSKRLKKLIAPDLSSAKRVLQDLDTSGNEYLTGLKQRLKDYKDTQVT